MEGDYWIGVEVQRGFDFNGAPCLLGYSDLYREYKCTGTAPIFKASWSVSSGGKVVAQGTSDVADWMMSEDANVLDRGIGAFNAREGRHYVLDVDILEDGGPLNAGYPRLGLSEFGGLRQEYDRRGTIVLVVALLFVGLGAVLIIRLKRKSHEDKRVSLTEPGPARRELRVASESGHAARHESPTAKKGWRLSFTAWLGICLILVGVVSWMSIETWMTTRSFVAVDMPVSLVPGQIKTGAFRINLKARYSIRIGSDLVDLPDSYETWMRYGEIQEFNAKCDTNALPQTRWVLYHNGKAIARSLGRGPSLAYFDAEKGIYALEVEVLSDASCLTSQHPKLRVSTSRSDYTDYANPLLSLSALFFGVGISMLVLSHISQFADSAAWTVSLGHSGTIGVYFQWAQKFQLKKVFYGLPAFGLVTVFTLFTVWVPVVLLSNWTVPPQGLKVHLVTPKALSMTAEPSLPPVLVQLKYDGSRGGPKLYLNSRPVSLGSLENELKKELKLRPDWVVYFEGDPDLAWGEAVQIIDIIRGVPAEVVLLTPESARAPAR